MKQGKDLVELLNEVTRQNSVKKDYLVDTASLRMTNDGGKQRLTLDNDIDFGVITPSAHRQLSTYVGIPAPYYDRLRSDAPDLLLDNVHRWLGNEPEQRMVRTLDDTARAFLSSRYRRIDNYEILEQAIPLIGEMGPDVRIISSDITDQHLYIKVVNPRLETEVRVGDPVQAGLIISNSETGHGSLTVKPLVLRLVCTNGMIAEDHKMRKYHTGVINMSAEDYQVYEDDTLQKADELLMLQLRDTMRAATSEVKFGEILKTMRGAAEAEIIAPPSAYPKLVELATKEVGANKKAGEGILDHLIRDKDFTLYGLGNAFTRYSQDVPEYEEATELEAAGWKVMSMNPALWKRLNKEAA